MREEFYVSVDVETDGPIPGPHSMLSLGAAAFTDDREVLGEFEVCLEELDGAKGHPDTMTWWGKQPKEIWEACRKDAQPPQLAMQRFVNWVNELAAKHNVKPVCVAYPAGFDWLFVYWYIVRFGQESPFSFSCLDIKSYASAKLGLPYRQSTKKNMPKRWFEDLPPHTHRAVDDAKEQGLLFLNMLNDGKS